ADGDDDHGAGRDEEPTQRRIAEGLRERADDEAREAGDEMAGAADRAAMRAEAIGPGEILRISYAQRIEGAVRRLEDRGEDRSRPEALRQNEKRRREDQRYGAH